MPRPPRVMQESSSFQRQDTVVVVSLSDTYYSVPLRKPPDIARLVPRASNSIEVANPDDINSSHPKNPGAQHEEKENSISDELSHFPPVISESLNST